MTASPHPSPDATIKPVTVLVCASPKAGRGQGREEIPKLVASLALNGINAVTTDSIQVIREHIDRFQSAADHSLILVACGGDGTISLLADLATPEIPIVPMPMGTENLLSRHFGFTANADDVVRTILQGHDYRIDAGLANGRLFLVMASCGFDAEVVRFVTGCGSTGWGVLQRVILATVLGNGFQHSLLWWRASYRTGCHRK